MSSSGQQELVMHCVFFYPAALLHDVRVEEKSFSFCDKAFSLCHKLNEHRLLHFWQHRPIKIINSDQNIISFKHKSVFMR